MDAANLFDVVAGMLRKDQPPMGNEVWGFGGYAVDPESATDVDILIVFANDALSKREQIWEYCTALKIRFQSLTGKELDISRLTAKETADINYITLTNAVRIWP